MNTFAHARTTRDDRTKCNPSWLADLRALLECSRTFLWDQQFVLAHVGDERGRYLAINSQLHLLIGVFEQSSEILADASGNDLVAWEIWLRKLHKYLSDQETVRRLDTSGAGLNQWARIVLAIPELIQKIRDANLHIVQSLDGRRVAAVESPFLALCLAYKASSTLGAPSVVRFNGSLIAQISATSPL